jgi:hypothetical protein
MAKYKKKINEKAFKSLLHDIDPKNIAKILTGKESGDDIVGKIIGKNSEEKIFAGKIVNDTATKLKPIDEEPGLTDMLAKIYGLMKTANERRTKQKELENNYKEEIATERQLRHKELIDAIKKAKGNTFIQSAEKVDDTPGRSVIDDVLDGLGLAKNAIKALATLGGFLLTPLGAGLIFAIGAGAIVAWIAGKIKEDPQAALRGEGPVGSAVAGPGAEAQLPSYETEMDEKAKAKLAKGVDDKGLSRASIQELEAKREQLISYGDPRYRVGKGKGDKKDIIRAKEIDALEAEIQSRKATSVPVEKTMPVGGEVVGSTETATKMPSALPEETNIPIEQNKSTELSPNTPEIQSAPKTASYEETPNQSIRLNNVINENQTNKIMAASDSSEDVNVVNNQVVNRNSQKVSMSKSALPAVRNLEATYQRMIYDSTRIV